MPDFASAGKAIADRTCFRGFRLSQYEVLFRQTETYRPFFDPQNSEHIASCRIRPNSEALAAYSGPTDDDVRPQEGCQLISEIARLGCGWTALSKKIAPILASIWTRSDERMLIPKISRRCSVATRMIRMPRLGRLFVNGPEVSSHGISSVTRIEAGRRCSIEHILRNSY